jgi:hypothetical protein
MDELTQKISEFLLTNPNSSAREIGKEIGFSKNEVNSCLYANEGTYFSKEGLTPPLWVNTGESSEIEKSESELAAADEDESSEDLEVENEEQEEDWTRLDAEDQEEYLVIKTLISLGVKVSKEDRRRMNQLVDRIRKAERSETASVEKQKYRAKNRAKYAAEVNEKVKEMWSVDEQRSHAKEALTRQFESYLRKLAYGYANLNKEKQFDGKTENDLEIRLAELRERIDTASTYLETRLNDLENLSDADLVSAGARLAWYKLTSNQSKHFDPRSVDEIFPKLDEIESVKIYKSRFQEIIQRVNQS